MEVQITDIAERKMAASIGEGGSVTIRKHYLDEKQGWLSREITINADEWDKINEERKKIINK